MPKIVLNPRLPNRIRLVDFEDYANGSETQRADLAEWYENGDLIVLSNYKFKSGMDLFNRVSFPNKRGANKLLLHLDDPRHGEAPRPDEWQAARELVEKKKILFDDFERAVRSANTEIMDISDRLFRQYRYFKRYCIYNLAEMLAHNMHFDSPEHAGEVTQMRVFVNIDNFPRIWRVGSSLEEMATICYRSADLRSTLGQHARQFTRQTTLACFGDRFESGGHPFPMHSIAFQPGEVWFLNPNMLAHEVVYGRRILDGVFLFEAADLRDPNRFYPRIVERIHDQNRNGVANFLSRWGVGKFRP